MKIGRFTFWTREVAPDPIDWNARLEADRAVRERLIGRPYAKRRAAALKGLGRG